MSTRKKIKIIGWYQIVGGALGVLVVLLALIPQLQNLSVNSLVFALMLPFFFFSIYCGMQCLKSREFALKLSILNQLLQVFGFAVFGYSLTYASGIFISIGLDLTNSVDFKFEAGVSRLNFNFNSDPDLTLVNVNIVALYLVFWIDKIRTTKKKELMESQMANINA